MRASENIDEVLGQVRWDLSDLYTGIDAPELDADLARLVNDLERFHASYAGRLAMRLGDALATQGEITCRTDQLMVYLFLRRSTDATNPEIQKRLAEVQERFSEASANFLTFFEHELAALPDDVYQNLLDTDARVKRHQPMLDQLRKNRGFLLDQNVERALSLRSPFGASEWSDLMV